MLNFEDASQCVSGHYAIVHKLQLSEMQRVQKSKKWQFSPILEILCSRLATLIVKARCSCIARPPPPPSLFTLVSIIEDMEIQTSQHQDKMALSANMWHWVIEGLYLAFNTPADWHTHCTLNVCLILTSVSLCSVSLLLSLSHTHTHNCSCNCPGWAEASKWPLQLAHCVPVLSLQPCIWAVSHLIILDPPYSSCTPNSGG